MKSVQVCNAKIGNNSGLVLIAGPCVIESKDHCFHLAKKIKEVAAKYSIPFVFKASYDKANRSSIQSYRGPGIDEGLKILSAIKEKYNIPIISDIHSVDEARRAAEILDVIQIPAFLCRQTDLLIAAAETGKVINVKKGQFLSPWDMKNVIEKLKSTGNDKVLLTERGTSFGYNYLVSDMRSLVVLRSFGYPVIFDATHSVQMPGGKGTASGGQNEFIPYLARAAVAVGIDGLFIEVHDQPELALSDSHNMLSLESLDLLIKQITAIDKLVKGEMMHGCTERD